MYSSLRKLAVVAMCSMTALAAPATKTPRASSRADDPALNAFRANAVKEAFQFAWDGYMEFAFPHDELLPVSNGFADTRNGWGASAVDALSTALVMEIPDIVDTIVNYIPTIDFDHALSPDDGISLFETTIRYVGGMLSGYDLLKGPLSHLATNATAVEAILAQTVRLANNLAFAFDTPSGVPSNNLFFDPSRTDGGTTNGIATIGTLVLEYTRLSDLTGNQSYAQLVQRGESFLLNPHPASAEPFPGLIGTNVDINTGLFLDDSGGWVGGDDSFYEYLIKMYVYDKTRFAHYKERWVLAADSSIEHLASHPSTRPDLTFLAEFSGTQKILVSEHLACFDGGNFILAGLVLEEQKYIDFGLELVNGCHDTYTSELVGIGPEVFAWVEADTPANSTLNPPPPADQQEFYEKAGFYNTDPFYDTRPEVVESYYYAFRATGDQMYRDWAWDAFVAINATCRANSGFSNINNVNAVDGGGFGDFQESFLFAEVMKYMYLIQAPDAEFQAEHNGVNQFVFNTEAHPVKVAGPPI